MRLTVAHTTRYRFDPPMRGVTQSLRVWPSLFAGQRIVSWTVGIEGAARGASFRDGAGDLIETAAVLGNVSEVVIDIAGEVETTDLSGVLRGHREKVPPEAYLRPTAMTRGDQAVADLSRDAMAGEDDPLRRAHALARAVNEAVAYDGNATGEGTTAAEALALGRGVCQDHAHALIAVAHAAEIPARYVTGYLHASVDGGAYEASHAWAELWVAGLGWVGFDAANGCSPSDLYIRLGSGHDAVGAAPVRGIAAGVGIEALEVNVSVTAGGQ
jgi:transglutaminase-like putative cysteine protease